MKFRGYTLIEVLIALTVFSILAATTAYSLFNAFHTRNLVNQQANQLSELQLAVVILQRDVKQIIERSSYGNDMHFYPPFIGKKNYIEFTRDGVFNTNKTARSNLRRVAYTCKQGKLLRRQWEEVDTPNRNDYTERVILNHLNNCSFDFLSASLETISDWKAAEIQQNQQKATLPKAIQFNFTIPNWGKMNLMFSLPITVYAIN